MSNVQEALKAALVAIDLYDYTMTVEESEKFAKAESLCKAALAEIDKCEPVINLNILKYTEHGVIPDDFKGQASGYRAGWNDCLSSIQYMFSQPIEKCEPVGWYCKACKETGLSHCSDPENCGGMVRTYTSPISKEWVVIDEKTIDDIGNTLSDEQGFIPVETWTEFARAIEAKLKQLNVLEKG